MARGVRCALQYGISERPWRKISLQDWEWGCCLNNGGRSVTRRRVWIFTDVRWVMYRRRCVHSSWSYRSQRQALWQLLSYITNKDVRFSVGSGNACKHWQMWLRPPVTVTSNGGVFAAVGGCDRLFCCGSSCSARSQRAPTVFKNPLKTACRNTLLPSRT